MYKSLIDRTLIQIYNQLKDLAEPIQFIKNTPGEFDFSLGEMAKGSTKIIHTKAVIMPMSKQTMGEKNTMSLSLLLKARDIGKDITSYDRVVLRGKEWAVDPNWHSQGFTYKIQVTRRDGEVRAA